MKTTTDGSVIWTNGYGNIPEGGSQIVQMNSDNTFTYTNGYGSCISEGGLSYTIEENGVIQNTTEFLDNCIIHGLPSESGGFVLYSYDFSNSHPSIIKTNASGSVLWEYQPQPIIHSGQVELTPFIELDDGSIIDAGFVANTDSGGKYTGFILSWIKTGTNYGCIIILLMNHFTLI